MKTAFTLAIAFTALLLTACNFSVGEPRHERVADAVKQGIEERGHEVVSISFEEDDDDRDIYHGEAVVRLDGTDEEVTAECRVEVDEEQTISSSECPGIDDAIRANNIERTIAEHYQRLNAEPIYIQLQGDQNGGFTGYAEVRDPQTGQPTRLNCTAQMVGDGADWSCNRS